MMKILHFTVSVAVDDAKLVPCGTAECVNEVLGQPDAVAMATNRLKGAFNHVEGYGSVVVNYDGFADALKIHKA